MSILYYVGAGLGNQIMCWHCYAALVEKYGQVGAVYGGGVNPGGDHYTRLIFPKTLGRKHISISRKSFTSLHGGDKYGKFIPYDGKSSEIRLNFRMIGMKPKFYPWTCPFRFSKEVEFDVVIAPRSSAKRKDYSEWNAVSQMLAIAGKSVATVGIRGPALKGSADLTRIGLDRTFGVVARAGCVAANDSGIYHLANLMRVPNVVVFIGKTCKKKNYDPMFHRDAVPLFCGGSGVVPKSPEEVAETIIGLVDG